MSKGHMEALAALRQTPHQSRHISACAPVVTSKVTLQTSVTSGVTHCPTCGHKLSKLTPAQKQKAYRDRKKPSA